MPDYTVDVWIVEQKSEIVEADSAEEAREEARDIVETEYWPEEIQEIRVVGAPNGGNSGGGE